MLPPELSHISLLQQTLNIHSKTAEAQENYLKTKFIKMIEVLKEEKKLVLSRYLELDSLSLFFLNWLE